MLDSTATPRDPTARDPLAPARAERFRSSRATGGDLLRALADHAARLAGAQDAAIRASSPRGAWAGQTAVSTADDPEWLALVAEHASSALAPGEVVERTAAERQVAAIGVASAERRGVLVVGRTTPEPFNATELELLADVGRLVGAALEQAPPQGAAATRSRRAADPAAPAGDFHHRLPQAFQRLEGLPALAESRDVLLDVLDHASPSHARIIAAIESDVALLIAVLRLANEARAKTQPPVWSVPEAVAVLTPEGVETMARRITVFDFFQRIRGWTVPPEKFRLHAVATQRAAERLTRAVDHPHPDQMTTAALLHDVGKLVLMEAFSTYPDGILAGAATAEERLDAERAQLGLDHQMAGGVLIRRWGLPTRLAAIVSGHHGGTDDRDAALIGLSDALAHYGHGNPVSPRELQRTAAAAGVTGSQLRTVMYELSGPDAKRTTRHASPCPLTRRERDLLRELAKGMTYKDIAAETNLARSTVRTHLHNAYRKIGVVDRAQAVLTATENGWL